MSTSTPGTARRSTLDPLRVIDRSAVLELLSRHLTEAWVSFDGPRLTEPSLTEELRARLGTQLPEETGDVAVALSDASAVLDASVAPARPLFTAYIGSTGLEAGVIAGALAVAYDVNMAVSAGAVELLEEQAVSWMAQFIGYPQAEGIFTSGGMTSNLTALLTAREHALPGSRATGVQDRAIAVYCSAEAHHSVVRAVEVAGLGSNCIRRIPVDELHRLRPEALAEALAVDRRDGVTAVAVIATGGTTLTGAVDPLDAVADLCAEYGVWMHVDGAYGVPAAGVLSMRSVFAGLERADSVTIDAHKWMGVQKSCSLLLLRRAGGLRAAFSHEESYMLHKEDTANAVDQTLEYSRPVNSLKLWLAFRTYGAAAYRSWIERTIQHVRDLTAELDAREDYETLHVPMLSTLCFRHTPAGVQDLDAHNLHLAAASQAEGRIFLAPATIDGKVCLRVCFTNFRTRAAHVREIVTVLDDLASRLD